MRKRDTCTQMRCATRVCCLRSSLCCIAHVRCIGLSPSLYIYIYIYTHINVTRKREREMRLPTSVYARVRFAWTCLFNSSVTFAVRGAPFIARAACFNVLCFASERLNVGFSSSAQCEQVFRSVIVEMLAAFPNAW